jgi:hypothetical protein
MAKEAAWSPTGRYLLAVRHSVKLLPEVMRSVMTGAASNADPGEFQLILWNMRAQEAKPVWSVRAQSGSIDGIQWMNGAEAALITVRSWSPQPGQPPANEQTRVLLYNVATGRLQSVAQTESESLDVQAAPKKPVALITFAPSQDRAKGRILLVGPNGPIGAQVEVAAERFEGVVWGADGETLLTVQRVAAADGGRPKIVASRLDPLTGRAVLDPSVQFYYNAKGEGLPGVIYPSYGKQAMVQEGTSVDIKTLWLTSTYKSDLQHAFLAADVSSVSMSPTEDSVFYVSQGIGYVRSLVRLPRDLFEKMLAAADRRKVMSNTKQAVTALLMYTMDNDDKMPMKEEDILGLLYPYTKDGEVLRGFVYTFAGGDITKLSDPAGTEIGYMEGAGGRAVAYADGHVIWKANP